MRLLSSPPLRSLQKFTQVYPDVVLDLTFNMKFNGTGATDSCEWQINQLILFDCQPWQWRQRCQVKLYNDYRGRQ